MVGSISCQKYDKFPVTFKCKIDVLTVCEYRQRINIEKYQPWKYLLLFQKYQEKSMMPHSFNAVDYTQREKIIIFTSFWKFLIFKNI